MSRGKWKKPRKKTQAMIDSYRDGLSLREVAGLHGCSWQWVHQALQRWCPDEIREPHQFERFAQGPGR